MPIPARSVLDNRTPTLELLNPSTADYKLLEVYPHDPGAFTQGLTWYNGSMYESTGQHRQSEVWSNAALNANKS